MTANATGTNTMLTVYMTSDYCGGANPSDEILDDLKTPRLLKSKSIFIKVGEKKIVGYFTCNGKLYLKFKCFELKSIC